MLYKSLAMAAAVFVSFGAPAFAADSSYSSDTKIEKDSNGNYSEKDSTTSTDANGVKNTYARKVNVDVDSKGNADKTVTTDRTQKTGWFSKDSVKTKDTEKTNADGTVDTTHKKVVNGTTVENDTHTSTSAQ